MASPRSNKEGGFISPLANTVTLHPERGNTGEKKVKSAELGTRTVGGMSLRAPRDKAIVANISCHSVSLFP